MVSQKFAAKSLSHCWFVSIAKSRSFGSLRCATVAQDDSSVGGCGKDKSRSFGSLPLRLAQGPVAEDDSLY
jgi:hypothetical protein